MSGDTIKCWMLALKCSERPTLFFISKNEASINDEYVKWANNFDRISVREDSGIKLCKDYLNVSVEKVLDPTLLLNSYDYEN